MSNYFSRIPDFEYINPTPGSKIGDFIKVKNFFKKGVIRDDIFQNVSFFTKYKIKGDERPDNVAFQVYEDSTLDWIVLTSNNIINIQTEWPLPQNEFNEIMIEKYGDYNTFYNGIHHHETIEIKNSQGSIVVPAGLRVQEEYFVSYYDYFEDAQVNKLASTPITNYEYEEKIENEKRNIYLLKPIYLNVVLDDLEEMMKYKKGSTQYKSETLKRGDDIRLTT